MSTIEVTNHWWDSVIVAWQRKGVGSDDIESRQPDTSVMFAALGEYVSEDVKLCQHGIEAQSQKGEAPLCFRWGSGMTKRAMQPAQIRIHQAAQRATAIHQCGLDRDLRRE
jgi:hypothetical protein